jgi:hypothetical protein
MVANKKLKENVHRNYERESMESPTTLPSLNTPSERERKGEHKNDTVTIDEMTEEEKVDAKILFGKLESEPLFTSILLNVLESVRGDNIGYTGAYDPTIRICLLSLFNELPKLKAEGQATARQRWGEIQRRIKLRKMETNMDGKGIAIGGSKTRKSHCKTSRKTSRKYFS